MAELDHAEKAVEWLENPQTFVRDMMVLEEKFCSWRLDVWTEKEQDSFGPDENPPSAPVPETREPKAGWPLKLRADELQGSTYKLCLGDMLTLYDDATDAAKRLSNGFEYDPQLMRSLRHAAEHKVEDWVCEVDLYAAYAEHRAACIDFAKKHVEDHAAAGWKAWKNGWKANGDCNQVQVDGNTIQFTAQEFRLVEPLSKGPESRDQLEGDGINYDGALTTALSRLRKKLPEGWELPYSNASKKWSLVRKK